LPGIAAAVTRRTLDGKHPNGWVPEQKMTAEETVRAFTTGSAYAEFSETIKGTITPGKLADLVILSQDILRPDFDWAKASLVRVVATIFDGRVVYQTAEPGR
jgi:predicted amidohydrolase YtcJ